MTYYEIEKWSRENGVCVSDLLCSTCGHNYEGHSYGDEGECLGHEEEDSCTAGCKGFTGGPWQEETISSTDIDGNW